MLHPCMIETKAVACRAPLPVPDVACEPGFFSDVDDRNNRKSSIRFPFGVGRWALRVERFLRSVFFLRHQFLHVIRDPMKFCVPTTRSTCGNAFSSDAPLAWAMQPRNRTQRAAALWPIARASPFSPALLVSHIAHAARVQEHHVGF